MADMASELEAAAVRLRRAGDSSLIRELTAAMHRGVQPVPAKIRAGLLTDHPRRYTATLDADLDIKTTARSGSVTTDAVVSVYAQPRGGKNRRLKSFDAGVLHHPLWGDRSKWFAQAVQPGWFTGPAEAAAPQVRDALEQALQDVANKAGA